MRIKFEKGFTPEIIAQAFVDYIRQNNIVIGSINMYIQTYDDEMKAVKHDNDEYIVCTPTKCTKKQYVEDVSMIRRSKIRAIV